MSEPAFRLSDLRSAIERRHKDLTSDEVKRAVDVILSTITETLAQGGRVELRDFGVFETRELSASTGRNPRTGETVSLPDRLSVGFRTGRNLHRRLNPNGR